MLTGFVWHGRYTARWYREIDIVLLLEDAEESGIHLNDRFLPPCFVLICMTPGLGENELRWHRYPDLI
jgi:hypothetical protein